MNPRTPLEAALAGVDVTGSTPAPMTRLSVHAALQGFPVGPPCRLVVQRRDAMAKLMTEGSRHRAATGPLMRLVALAAEGHAGVAEAVADLGEQFVAATGPDRDGGGQSGAAVAAAEWDRLLDGAVERTAHRTAAPKLICDCDLEDLEALACRDDIYEPRRRRAQQNTYRAVIRRARLNRTLLVRESLRQLSVTAQLGRLESLRRALVDLQKRGLLHRGGAVVVPHPARAGGHPIVLDVYLRPPADIIAAAATAGLDLIAQLTVKRSIGSDQCCLIFRKPIGRPEG